ncbi:hypothetical protein [Streptomyces zaomyceticus]|uniref:hypothetical protein n=1 Tax=Streptomyces zaomyceticus TaxID=68286 RepID=UPI0037981F15
MTERPYTDEDLRAEAARQHSTLTEAPDYVDVGEAMEDRMVTPDGNVEWGDFTDETHAEAQRSIHDLISGAADVSEWAVNLGADGLEPDGHYLQLGVDPGDGDRPRVRIHFAFHPDMDDDARDGFVFALSRRLLQDLADTAA